MPKRRGMADAGGLFALTPEAEPAPGHLGHRERLRARFLAGGAEAVADYELLELLLFAIPRLDTKPLAKALIAAFGSFAAVLAAPKEELAKVPGVGEAVIATLKVAHAAALKLAASEVADRPVLNAWDKLMAYLHAALAREPVEQFRVLYLDNKNRLKADEAQTRGTVNHTPVYPREVVRRALELSASAIILVHNHPSGDPSPSPADIAMTKTIIDTARPLGVVVHDHIIVGKDGHASLKGMQLI